MANPYHSAANGQFISRTDQLANINKAVENKDWNSYVAELEALREVDAERNFIPETTPRNGVIAALSESEEEIVERDRLIREGNLVEVEAFVAERTNRELFVTLLDERDKMRQKSKELKSEYDFLHNLAEKDPEFDVEIVRNKGFELLDAYETLQILKKQAEEYKNITAPAVARMSELTEQEQIAAGTYREYDADTLNDLVRTGDYPSGSREWLEERQNGVGGSDVGKIIGANAGYETRDLEEVISSKVDPITDEQVEEQLEGHSGFEGAAGRGNAWEERIAHQFSVNNPDARITHCKSSFMNKDHNFQRVNFDGLMTDENGVPNGILEIKTASDSSKWGEPDSGLDGVPAGYRAQVLHYALNGGFDKGAVAVMIDDREYREYHFTMTPELQAEAASNFQKTKEFWDEVQERKNGTYVSTKRERSLKGFSANTLNSGISGAKEVIFQEAAIYRGDDVETVRARYVELIGDKENRKDPEKVREALRKLYIEADPEKTPPIVAIDLETSSGQPTKGHIIEVGVSTKNAQTGESEKFSRVYGLSKKSLTATGTGAVEVHGITESTIAKKARFNQPEPQRQLLEKLKSGVMLAHNANFEVRWLRQHLDGFWAAERRGEIKVLDSMRLSRRLLMDTKNDTLETFAERFGVPYVDAHRAFNDALIMEKAYDKFREHLSSENK
jgi:DNA polymerase III epsilon subunit-like protein